MAINPKKIIKTLIKQTPFYDTLVDVRLRAGPPTSIEGRYYHQQYYGKDVESEAATSAEGS